MSPYFLLMFSLCLVCALGKEYVAPSRGQPWPFPKSFTTTGQVNSLDAESFSFTLQGADCDILREAFVRYQRAIFGEQSNRMHAKRGRQTFVEQWSQGEVFELSVQVATACEGVYPSLESDESYNLTISEGNAVLVAKEVWGALWGLETFSQLVYRLDTEEFVVKDANIQDEPRFAYRGLLLDTSRHYLSKVYIMRNLDAMAQNKLNVFHWHIVDDPSFPYQSEVFPELSNKGAFFPESHIYTPLDIHEIIEFARMRGIRVVPEFDTPGHSQSWGAGQPGLLTKCYSGDKPNGNHGPIDPTLNTTMPFLRKFFTEVASLFPDKYMHMGGDEVSFDCWKSNPAISDFMQKMSFGDDYAKLEEYYMQNLLNITSSLQRSYVIWQEVIDNGAKVKADTVVEVWKHTDWQTEMAKVTGLGYKTLLAACWYLNKISYGADWSTYYVCEPHDFNGTDAQKALVMGGSLAMWGEWVDNTNVLSRLWPRGAAVAERLWSPKDVNMPQQAVARLEEHRCRMIKRGIPAEPVVGPGVCRDEYNGNL